MKEINVKQKTFAFSFAFSILFIATKNPGEVI